MTYSLIKNHPFLDGSKRIGVTVMIIFLKANGIEIICTNEELAALGCGLAGGSVTDMLPKNRDFSNKQFEVVNDRLLELKGIEPLTS